MFSEQERIEFNLKNEDMWRQRVLKGALLLDEIMPGWEQKINVDTLGLGSYGNDILAQVYSVSDMQQALPLVFAGKGLERMQGRRRQPGPPPSLDGNDNPEDIWKYTVSGAHWIAAEQHGFNDCPAKYMEHLGSSKLTLLWLELIMLRGIAALAE